MDIITLRRRRFLPTPEGGGFRAEESVIIREGVTIEGLDFLGKGRKGIKGLIKKVKGLIKPKAAAEPQEEPEVPEATRDLPPVSPVSPVSPVRPKKAPSWILPAAIGGGVLLVGILVLSIAKRGKP